MIYLKTYLIHGKKAGHIPKKCLFDYSYYENIIIFDGTF